MEKIKKCCENCCELCSGDFPYCVVDGNFKEVTDLESICDDYSDCRINIKSKKHIIVNINECIEYRRKKS